MNQRAKVELFAQIRHEYEFGIGTIAGVARQFGVHRRLIRQALQSALPPPRKKPARKCPALDPVRGWIDEMLQADLQAPRKQRHTAHRIYVRLREEHPSCRVGESTVRQYVREKKRRLGLLGREVFIPQSYGWGEEAQVDWYEATVELDGAAQVVQIFALRSMASGVAFHRAYPRATQQAFLEAHQLAFHYFGGMFQRLRYDNLKSAVKKVLRGHRREETTRFLAFRSHWQYEASFCTPGQGHEKGGVEGEIGYFRRNHLVPVPRVATWEELNQYLWQACQSDLQRRREEDQQTIGAAWQQERAHLRALQTEDFELTEEGFYRVDQKGCVQVRTNWYSTPLWPGTQVQVKVLAGRIEIWHQGKAVAQHLRCYQRRQQILELEHYLEALERKPGALSGARPLQQWRASGRWTTAWDEFWQRLQQRHGRQDGNRLMIELLQLGRQYGYGRLNEAINVALQTGAGDAAAVAYLVRAASVATDSPPTLSVPDGKATPYFTRPLPNLAVYDELLLVSPSREVTL